MLPLWVRPPFIVPKDVHKETSDDLSIRQGHSGDSQNNSGCYDPVATTVLGSAGVGYGA